MDGQRSVYTPSELNHEARLHLEAGFGRIWLEGEISNLSRPASGHLYFSLKDDKAQISCAFFRSSAMKVLFRPENGMQVQARGRLSLYEARGNYQLIVDSMEEAGAGLLQAAFEALKKKLQLEGLFDPERKQALPAYPKRIAVISSPSGAVIRDILNVLRRRWPLAHVRLYPVPVQGEEAAGAIVNALASANGHHWAEALILARGGGSVEDLQAFNEESVARAIADSGIPVISAVGHETDFTIADFVADERAPTPSAAAELATPDGHELSRLFYNYSIQLQRRIQSGLQGLSQQHDHLVHRLARQHPGHRMKEQQKLIAQLGSRLFSAGNQLAPDRRLRLERGRERLIRAGKRLVADRRQIFQELLRTLNAVSPLATLERGYAILSRSDDGRLVRSASEVEEGQKLAAQFSDGRVYATTDKVTARQLLDPEEKSGGETKA